jgi:hypothetical protein
MSPFILDGKEKKEKVLEENYSSTTTNSDQEVDITKLAD